MLLAGFFFSEMVYSILPIKTNQIIKKEKKIIKKKRKKERTKTEGQAIHIRRDSVADMPKRKDFKRPVKARPNESVSLICESDI